MHHTALSGEELLRLLRLEGFNFALELSPVRAGVFDHLVEAHREVFAQPANPVVDAADALIQRPQLGENLLLLVVTFAVYLCHEPTALKAYANVAKEQPGPHVNAGRGRSAAAASAGVIPGLLIGHCAACRGLNRVRRSADRSQPNLMLALAPHNLST